MPRPSSYRLFGPEHTLFSALQPRKRVPGLSWSGCFYSAADVSLGSGVDVSTVLQACLGSEEDSPG